MKDVDSENSVRIEEPIAAPIFIVSAERSGSTLLRYILDAHARICCPGELGLGIACAHLNLLLSRTLSQRGSDGEAYSAGSRSLDTIRQVLSGIMNAYARSRRKSIWCDKTPANVGHLDLLAAVFPSARFVCLYRHCMDVAQSCLESGKHGFMPELVPYVARSPHNLLQAMVDSWLEKTDRLLAFESANPSRCFRIRYEDLVCNTNEHLRRLFQFLGLEWEPDIVSRAFTIPHDQGGGDLKVNFTKGIERSSIGKGAELPAWRISPGEQRRLRATLQRLGYQPLPSAPLETSGLTANGELPAEKLASRLQDVFSNHVPARLHEHADQIGACGTLKFQITGNAPGSWVVQLQGAESRVLEGDHPADCTLIAQAEVILAVASGHLSALPALQDGRIKAKGNLGLVQKLSYIL